MVASDCDLLAFDSPARAEGLTEKESQPSHAEDLKSALLGALARVGPPGEFVHATLGDLVEEAFRRFRVR